jgi:signal transduction histidine kinase/ligand-binding sensor domain-containing protein
MSLFRPLLFILPVLLLLCLAVSATDAQELHPSIEHFSVENGLSQGTIRSILQDHQGFVWIGTNDGLNRFDGVEFTKFRHRLNDAGSLLDNAIMCLYEDRENVLWVGTALGLQRYNPASESFTSVAHAVDSAGRHAEYPVFCLYEATIQGQSVLLAGSARLGIVDREEGVFHPVHWNQGNPGAVTAITEDGAGSLWLLNGVGVFHVNPEQWSAEAVMQNSHSVSAIVRGKKEHSHPLWIGTRDSLTKFDRQGRTVLQHLPYHVLSLLENSRGELWVGTEAGLVLLAPDGSEEARFSLPEANGETSGLTDNFVLALCEESSGALWAGTYNGLNRLDEHFPAFTTYRHKPDNSNSLAHDFVLPILEARDGTIWIGTFGGGVSVMHRSESGKVSFTQFRQGRTTGSLRGDNVRALLEGRNGTIWIGTNEGLNRYNPDTRTFTCISRVPHLSQQKLWTESLFESLDGTLWVGTTDLVRIDHPGEPNMTFTVYTLSKDSVTSTEIRSGLVDRRGFLWLGTERGVVCFDPRSATYRRYSHNPSDSTSLSDNSVYSLVEDSDDAAGALWVGTSGGLNRFSMTSGKCERWVEQAGFPSSCVYGILKDSVGHYWLSTNHGISCFDPGRREGWMFRNFDVSDGVQGNEFNRRSYCRLRSGEFLFGGTHGITQFHPMHIRSNPYVPPVILTAFSKFGRKVQFPTSLHDVHSIELTYDENDFSFEFVALNYTNAIKNQYAYMMEGFDRNWTYSGTRRYAHYTHLDPGEYAFRVKASNNDGVWNESGASVHVSIMPPFWGTWWFRLASVLCMVGGLLLFYRRRVSALENEQRIQREFSLRLMESQENERKRIAGELHDSLGQNLLVIRNRALLGLKETGENTRTQLDLISSVASQAIEEVREIAYDLRPYQLDRLGLTKAIASITSGLATPIHFTVTIDPIDDHIGKEQAIHVYRIVQEGINNIVKHANASEASIAVRLEGEKISITISDNGVGTQQGENRDAGGRRGFGLVGISERARVLNGTVTVESAPGRGTSLRVVVPAARQTG